MISLQVHQKSTNYPPLKSVRAAADMEKLTSPEPLDYIDDVAMFQEHLPWAITGLLHHH